MTKDYLKNNTFVKTILMLSVILGHSCAFWSGHWFTENPAINSPFLNIIYLYVNTFHIYAFALISGYIFAFKRLNGGYGRYIPFLKVKAMRLLIPYAFTAFMWAAPLSAFFFHLNIPQLFKNYVLGINPSQLWFLLMLFGVFAIAWPMWGVFKSTFGLPVAIAFYVLALIGKRFFPNVFCIWKTCQYLPFFTIGIQIRIKEEKTQKKITEMVPLFVWLLLHISLFVLFIFMDDVGSTDIIWNVANHMVGFILNVIGALTAFITLHTIVPRLQWESCKVLRTLSSSSMPMYLFHQQIIYFTITWLNGLVSPIVNAAVNFLVAVAMSLLLSLLMMRWKVTRFLIGEK